MKLDIPSSALGLDAFAHFYRWPEERREPAPLVVWVGGAISPEEYEKRRLGEPRELLAELERARERLGGISFDALMLSAPPALLTPDSRAENFYRFLAFEIFPLLPPPRPTALGLVGNSFGAHLLASFAAHRPDVRALATIAGVFLWNAFAAAESDLPPDLKLKCFANDEDPASEFADELRQELAARGRELTVVSGPGGHPFADYAANGFVTAAFEFALGSCAGR